MVWLFSYGSNDPGQLGQRIRRPVTDGQQAIVNGYQRVFRGWSSRRECGVASLERKRGATTYGWAAKVSAAELRKLDVFEGVNSGCYKRKKLKVFLPDRDSHVNGIAYVSTSGEYGAPSQAYLEACAVCVGTFWSDPGGRSVEPGDFPLRNPGWRRNADVDLRELERRAAAGDAEAMAAVAHMRLRSGTATLEWLAHAGPGALAALPNELVQALERVVTAYQASQPDDTLSDGLTVGETRKRLARYPQEKKVLLGVNVGDLEHDDAEVSLSRAQGLYGQLEEVGINHLPHDQYVRLDTWWGPG